MSPFLPLPLLLLCLVGTPAAVVGSETRAGEPPKQTLPAEPKSSDPKTLAADNARFAFDLYRHRALTTRLTPKVDANILYSPHSVSECLAMVAAGAEGETAAELKRVMRWSMDVRLDGGELTDLTQGLTGNEAVRVGRVHDSFAGLMRRLAPPAAEDPSRTYEWTEANRVWLATPAQKAYTDLLSRCYAADAGVLDADAEVSAARINAWTDQHTKHRISKLVEGRSVERASLVLTNAVYFKGSWVEPFPIGATAPRAFTTLTSVKVEVPTMADVRTVPYMSGEGFSAVKLHYQGGMSMVVLLAGEDRTFMDRNLTAESFAETCRAFKPTLVDLQLPKFKFQTRDSMKMDLGFLGMEESFSDRAKFTKMAAGGPPLRIEDVIHVADVEVDEKGTVAAAATAAPLRPTAAPVKQEEPPKPVIFHADHPFTVVIRHEETGAVLFIGRVGDPRAHD